MTITTRTAKGSQLSIAEMDANLTDLNSGALKTSEVVWEQATGFTVPDGTGRVVLSPTSKQYYGDLTLPPNPVNGQRLEIVNASQFSAQYIALLGNGKTILGDATIQLPGAEGGKKTGLSAYTLGYTTALGWFPVQSNPMFSSVASGDIKNVGFFPGGGGIGWSWPNGSADAYLQLGAFILQSTNSGTGAMPTHLRNWVQSTPDVTDTSPNYFRYSWNGFLASCNNSSIPFGAGATNDRPLSLILACQPNAASYGGSNISGVGGGNYVLSWASAVPFIFGSPTAGEHARFDTLGNFIATKVVADASEVRNTGTASFTVSDNVSTCILAGSGTITLTFPATPVNGQDLTITLETAYTAITLAGNGKTIITGAALGVSAGSFARYRYRAANTTWHRVG